MNDCKNYLQMRSIGSEISHKRWFSLRKKENEECYEPSEMMHHPYELYHMIK